jgi:predicted RNA polymerase sigma factor
MTVARNGAIDRLRRSSTYRAKVEELAVMATRETRSDNHSAGNDIAGYYLLPATRADFLRRLGRNEEAASAYKEAAALAVTGPESRFLNARLAEVRSRHS